jgi:outer membrane protein assembly factor BamB
MKKVLAFAISVLFCGEVSSASEYDVNTFNLGVDIRATDNIHTAFGDVFVGVCGGRPFAQRVDQNASLVWNTRGGDPGTFTGISQDMTSLDVVCVGHSLPMQKSFVAKFSFANGEMVWSYEISPPADSSISFFDVDVDSDGYIYLVGRKSSIANPQGESLPVAMKIDAEGNVVWSLESAPVTLAGHYKALVKGDYIFAFGQSHLSTLAVSVTKLDKATGQIVSHVVLGGTGGVNNKDFFRDAVILGEKLVLCYSPQASNGLVVVSLDQDLAMLGSTFLYSSDGDWGSSASLATLGEDVYLSSTNNSGGSHRPFVIRMNSNLQQVWGRRAVVGQTAVSSLLTAGSDGQSIRLLTNKTGGTSVHISVSQVLMNAGAFVSCEVLEEFGIILSLPYSPPIVSPSISDPDATEFVFFGATFAPFTVDVDPCGLTVSAALLDAKKSLHLYPNPARAGEMVNFSSPFIQLIVRDELGRIVPYEIFGQTSFVLKTSGVYLVSVMTERGMSTHKVMIH